MVMSPLEPDGRGRWSECSRSTEGLDLQNTSPRDGPSGLKTHRVVATLMERGIVHVERRGNTKEVTLAKWFLDGMG